MKKKPINAFKDADENLEVAKMNLYTNIAAKSPRYAKTKAKKRAREGGRSRMKAWYCEAGLCLRTNVSRSPRLKN
ncbi:hypothetical protein BGX38DRAFT_1277088 [Terfezia claveryi]|nr:hypothetical protein BGX38DRAFT_1277088 [Terfezia claveryi]